MENINTNDKSKADLYQTVTDSIIKMIEEGQFEKWRKSWGGGFPRNLATGQAYSGINILLLANSLLTNGYAKPYFLTLKQANKLGGTVKSGERATQIIYWNIIEKESDALDENDEPVIETSCYLKRYFVFNVAQIEGEHVAALSAKYGGNRNHARINEAEKWLDASGAVILCGGYQAYYAPGQDKICVPDLDKFNTANDFYSATFHELAHWTGHPTRLARDFSGRFGDESYAFEELIAELAASFIDAELGFSGFKLPDHVNYIASWLRVLKNDKKAIFTAASQANTAFKYLSELRANMGLLDKVA